MKFFIFSLMCLLSILILTIILGVMKGFSVFVIIGLVLASVSLVAVFISAAYYSFISAVVVSLKLGSVSPPILFFLKIVLAIQGPLSFHRNFRISVSISARKSAWILTGITPAH